MSDQTRWAEKTRLLAKQPPLLVEFAEQLVVWGRAPSLSSIGVLAPAVMSGTPSIQPEEKNWGKIAQFPHL
jgi:hypothetical protein